MSETKISPLNGAAAPPLDRRRMRQLLELHFDPSTPKEYLRVLERTEKRRDGVVARMRLPEDPRSTVILKFWSRPGLKGWLRRLTRTSSAWREFEALSRLHRAALSVPEPYGLCRVEAEGAPYTDALFMEDLGPATWGPKHFLGLLREGRQAEAQAFLETLIDFTERMLQAGVIDPDHGINNVLVPASGTPVRIDFEIARIVKEPRRRPELLGRMLGRLIATYTFLVQPDAGKAEEFAERLFDRVQPDADVIDGTQRHLDLVFSEQKRACGVDTRVNLRRRGRRNESN
jgi:hypothetical protein